MPVFLAWRIPWSEEPGGLVHGFTKELDMTERLIHIHTHTHEESVKQEKSMYNVKLLHKMLNYCKYYQQKLILCRELYTWTPK